MIAILLASLLIASCVSTPSGKPVLRGPDARLLTQCARPLLLPKGSMSHKDIERYWGADRVALAKCGWTKKAMQTFFLNRDKGLRDK